MTEQLEQPTLRELDPLNPEAEPPLDRFCDVVLDGGVINGVVYPGFLIELARKFRFRSLGGTSVGAIAAALAAACEYNRRYGSNNGFNEGLAKMPGELADWVDESEKITRIRSLFQPDPTVRPLFNWFVDILGSRLKVKNETAAGAKAAQNTSLSYVVPDKPWAVTRFLGVAWLKAIRCFWPAWLKALNRPGPGWLLILTCVFLAVIYRQFANPFNIFWQITLPGSVLLFGVLVIAPVWTIFSQIRTLLFLPGSGACTGVRSENSAHQGLSEWLHEGVQKSAGLSLHKPLTFGNLWAAPCGPKDADGTKQPRSVDLRMITTCLSHGRIYELPLTDTSLVLMFKLSEFKPYFPAEVIDHLRRVSKRLSFDSCALLQRKYNERLAAIDPTTTNGPVKLLKLKSLASRIDFIFNQPEDFKNGLNDPDIRELPSADLPIVVAARFSMSCPMLFQNLPLIGFNFDTDFEDLDFVRLWFSDGGIGSNFPIHLFDKSIPRWPSFGLKILDDPPRLNSQDKPIKTYIPFAHKDGSDDNLLYPRDRGAFTMVNSLPSFSSVIKLLFSIYTSAKDGHDQSFLRMPDVRNRVVRIYMNDRAGNMLNLKIEPKQIIDLALIVGAEGGRNAALAYLGQQQNPRYAAWVNSWQDHRWVRFNMLTQGLRSYLKGFTSAVNSVGLPETTDGDSLIDQIMQASSTPPLRSRPLMSDEIVLTQAQSDELLAIVNAISALELQLCALDLPQPYMPEPMPVLRFKPQY
jgi:predicted acylesterase/phospholipase RssA